MQSLQDSYILGQICKFHYISVVQVKTHFSIEYHIFFTQNK